jgi:hypothetical protein
MIRTLLASVAAVAIAAGCGKSDRPAPTAAASSPKQVAAAPAPAGPALEHATAADLAREIADSDRLGTWGDLPRRWQGQTVRWIVTRHRAMCRSADDCHVIAFSTERPAQQGWMPELGFAPGQFDALTAACADRDPCEIPIEATLRKLEVSPELPTSVELVNVSVRSRSA